MALIMYLTRAPKHENVSIEDMQAMDDYFAWHNKKKQDLSYNSTFEKWCGRYENDLPSTDIVKYYSKFYTKKTAYDEYLGDVEHYSVLEQIARMGKMNQVFKWFINNGMNYNVSKEYFEVTKENLIKLLDACNNAKSGFELVAADKYKVNEEIAKKYMPLMEDVGMFFGSTEYDEWYAKDIIDFADVVQNILDTTDFENQVVYFNAIW